MNELWRHIERLCGAQEPLSWTMRELARRSGVNVSKLSRFKNDLSDLEWNEIEAIAAQFGMRGGDLTTDAGSTVRKTCDRPVSGRFTMEVYLNEHGRGTAKVNRTDVQK